MILKEACVESLEQSQRAQELGADRIELCANLKVDGLTPSLDLIEQIKTQLYIPMRVMIRPRTGDFVYGKEEIEDMKDSITNCKEMGVEGVVFGACNGNNELDIDLITELSDYAHPLKVTIHKAIDACDDPVKELKKLIEMGNIDSVLTSGKEETALRGKVLITKMIAAANDKIEVIACGKITDRNLGKVHKMLQARAYHGKRVVGGLEEEWV